MKYTSMLLWVALAGCSQSEKQTFTGSVGNGWDSKPVRIAAAGHGKTFDARVDKTGSFSLTVRGAAGYHFSFEQADGSRVPLRFLAGSSADRELRVIGGTDDFSLGRVHRFAPFVAADALVALEDPTSAQFRATSDEEAEDEDEDDDEVEVCEDDDHDIGDDDGDGIEDDEDDDDDGDGIEDDEDDDDDDHADEAAVPTNSPPQNIGSCGDDDDDDDDEVDDD